MLSFKKNLQSYAKMTFFFYLPQSRVWTCSLGGSNILVNSGKRGRKSFKNESQIHSNKYKWGNKTPIQHISFVGRNKEQVVVIYFHHKIFSLGKIDQHHRFFMPLLEKCYLLRLSKMEVDSSLDSSSSVKNAQAHVYPSFTEIPKSNLPWVMTFTSQHKPPVEVDEKILV